MSPLSKIRKEMQWLPPVSKLVFGMRDLDSGNRIVFSSDLKFSMEVDQT